MPTVDQPAGSGGDEQVRRKVPFLPTTNGQVVATLLAVVFLVGSVGYFLATRDTRPAPDSVDVGFLQDMITHHQQALEMANIELVSGAEPDVEVFAREILRAQAFEIGLMTRKLHEWGYGQADDATAMEWMGMPTPLSAMPGIASDEEMDALARSEGPLADALFVRLMQDHHRGGVHMAEYAAANAQDPFVKQLAEGFARNQRIEIEELEAARLRANLDPAPPGYEGTDAP